MLKSRLLLIATALIASTAMSTAMADEVVQRQCEVVALPDAAAAKPVASNKKAKVEAPVQPGADAPVPAVINFVEHPLAGDLHETMLELIKMMIPTRSTGFSYKDMEGKDQGNLILGVELDSNYSLELDYASDFRQTDRFVLDKILLIGPNGKDEALSKDPLNNDGTLRDKVEIDPNEFPQLAGRQIAMPIFSQIDAKVIRELESIGPRLELLTKDELRAVAKVKSYAAVRAYLRYKSAAKNLKKYVTQGPFKQAYSLTMGSALSLGVTYAMAVAMPHQAKELLDVLKTKKHPVAAVTVGLPAAQMPKNVRVELKQLEANVDKNGLEKVDRTHYPALLTYLEMQDAAQAANDKDKTPK